LQQKYNWHTRYNSERSFAATFVSNIDISEIAYINKFRDFHLLVDEYRFGKRAHRKPVHDRLDFIVAPEGFLRANPHYHGFLTVPDTGRGFDATTPPEQAIKTIQDIWKAVAPAGNLQLDPISNGAGWESYCSKESSLDADGAIWSLSNFVRP
jgi:hypothetical protein